jgi:predicted NAD/FAD-dependent oxidoreductase
MLDEEKKIFVKEIPHGIYNYQAYLHPHKLTSSQTERTQLADWLELQVPKITFSNSIRKWVLQTQENWDRRYIYIDNEQTLLMIKLRSPELIGKVFKYVKTDK